MWRPALRPRWPTRSGRRPRSAGTSPPTGSSSRCDPTDNGWALPGFDNPRAVDLHAGFPAAVKLLLPQEGTDAEARHRLEREGEIVSALSHPNVVRLLARGEHDGRLYVAMELLVGDTVQARLQRGPLPPEDVLSAARQIASALSELHRRGVVHRDLNAANVIHVAPDRHFLLDFGLARRIDASILTAAHSILSTIPYMSPE